MATSNSTPAPNNRRQKRGREETEATPELQDSSDIIKELLKEMRTNSVVLRQVQEELTGVKGSVLAFDNECKTLSDKVNELAQVAIGEKEELEARTLSPDEKKKIKKICEELWWVQKDDVKAALALALEDTHRFTNRSRLRLALRTALQWFCNKRSNFRLLCEAKAPGFFLNQNPNFNDPAILKQEMEDFTKHLLNNKRRHTESDVTYVTKILTNYYVGQ